MSPLRLCLLLPLALFAAGCAFECGPATCAQGCCEQNVCYQGAGRTGGGTCSVPPLQDGGNLPAGCKKAYELCSGNNCCEVQPGSGNPLVCETTCRERCGTYSDPCNASLPCCPSLESTYGYVCQSERCAMCVNRNKECNPSSSTKCCFGLSCKLKPGFTSVYECQ